MASTYEPIASITVTGTPSDITFTSIPGTYTDLVLIFQQSASTDTGGRFQVNGDTGSNYSDTRLGGNGSSASSERYSNLTVGYPGIAYNTTLTIGRLTFMSYANTNVYKTVLSESGNAGVNVHRGVVLWRSTSAITSIKMFPSGANWDAGSTFALYGIKAA